MGEDFYFWGAVKWYKNMDNLIKAFNEWYEDFKLVYSTPSRYIQSLKTESVVWPVKQDDGFPYSDGPHAYWTGYFTSRATSKGFIWDLNWYFDVYS